MGDMAAKKLLFKTVKIHQWRFPASIGRAPSYFNAFCLCFAPNSNNACMRHVPTEDSVHWACFRSWTISLKMYGIFMRFSQFFLFFSLWLFSFDIRSVWLLSAGLFIRSCIVLQCPNSRVLFCSWLNLPLVSLIWFLIFRSFRIEMIEWYRRRFLFIPNFNWRQWRRRTSMNSISPTTCCSTRTIPILFAVANRNHGRLQTTTDKQL